MPARRRTVTLIGQARAPDLVITGSHCVALDAVLGALSAQGISARTIAIGSMGGVAAARRGECDLAPIHLMDPATGVYNEQYAQRRACAGARLAAHAGLRVPARRCALRGQERARTR